LVEEAVNQRFRVFFRGIDSLTDLSWLTCPKRSAFAVTANLKEKLLAFLLSGFLSLLCE